MLSLLCLLVVASTVDANINLTSLSYVRLEDANGDFSIEASTYNRLAFDPSQGILYSLAREPARLTVFTLNLDGTLTKQAVRTFETETKGQPLDIEFCSPSFPFFGVDRLAISFTDPSSSSADGTVRFYNPLTAGDYVLGAPFRDVAVGAEPMDMEFAQECLTLLVANRGRPTLEDGEVRDPEGIVTRIQTPIDFEEDSQITVTQISFALVNDRAYLAELMSENFRPWPLTTSEGPIPDITVSKNVEPVNIIASPNGQNAYVAMPKNNAIARITLDTNMVANVFPSGNRSWDNFYLDASRSDMGAVMQRFDVYSTLQPRQIKWVVQDEAQWLISLDSGFIDNIPEYNYVGARLGSTLAAGTDNTAPPISVSPELRAQLEDDTQLGEAQFSIDDGKSVDGTQLNHLFLNGGRGISIRRGRDLSVATSLIDNIERETAKNFGSIFNTGYIRRVDTPQMNRDATSPTYGPDLSVIETGIYKDQMVLFLGGGSSGIIYVYVLVPGTDSPQPYFHAATHHGNIFDSWQDAYNQGTMGDIGITDMLYIPRQGRRYVDVLAVASSTSNSVHTYLVSEV